MLSSRNVITAIVALAVLSMAYTVYDLATPPDAGGLGSTSYGTRAHGHRAVYQVLEILDQKPQRSHFPPPAALPQDASLVFIAPNQRLVEYEPEHLRRTSNWIHAGGHAVIAAKSPYDYSISELPQKQTGPEDLLTAFGLAGAELTYIDLSSETSSQDDLFEKERQQRENEMRVQLDRERPTGTTTVTLHKALAPLTPDIRTLRLPRQALQVLHLTTATAEATPLVTLHSDTGAAYTLVASFPHGQGTAIIVSDAALFNNYTLAQADNSVLATNLLAGWRSDPVFDEFFHGLTSRGNPLWLLTRPHYGWLFLMIVVATAVWIWRQSAALGPPVPPSSASRRNLSDYLSAMASLFTRSRQRKFILAELRDGVIWSLRQELHLPPGQETAHHVAAALARHHPERAEQLQKINREIEQALSQRQALDNHQFAYLTREINRCL